MGCAPLKSRWCMVIAVAVLFATCPTFAADPEPVPPEPEQLVAKDNIDALHGTFLAVMKQAEELGFDGRLSALTGVVEGSFDLEFMALKTIGVRRKQLETEDQTRWIASFGNFLLSNYARRFDGWSGQTFETLLEEEAPRSTMVVRTRLIRPGDEDVKLDYRLRPTDSGWRIIDIYSNGTVSELALRRSEFAALFKDVGLDLLIASVDEKAARR